MIRSVDPQHTTKELAIMKAFMDKDFLLETPTAQHLYHDYAETLPIVANSPATPATYLFAGD